MTPEDYKPKQEAATALQPSDAAPVPALRPDPPTPASKRRVWLWGAGGAFGIGVATLIYSQVWMTPPTAVLVEVAALAPVTRVLAVNGQIAAVHSVDVRSVVSGSLAVLAVVEGDLVEAGQILARVNADAQTAITRQAMAGFDAALVAQQEATAAYERARSLGANIATAALETSARAVQSAAQEVARLTAVVDQASIVLEDHTIRAPIAGSVVSLDAEQGQIVGPSTPLLTLADLNNLVVEADVDEAYATHLSTDMPAILQLAGEVLSRDGHVSFVSSRVDVSTGGLAIEIAFEIPVAAPIGLTVATNIIVDQRDAALSIPRTALFTGADGTGVYLVTDGLARFQPLTVTDWPAARLLVTQGLAVGDMVITDAADIAGGQAVTVVQP